MRSDRPVASNIIPLACLILLAANLRPALTSVGPLIDTIRLDTGMSGAAAGVLSGLPIAALGVLAPLGHLGRRFGAERTIVGALALVALGIVFRSTGSTLALFGGTVCLGAGIAIANVLLPSIIKRDFPDRVGGLTTAYAVTLGLTAAIGSGLAVPLAASLPGGWRMSLAIWSAPALIALLAWLPAARGSTGMEEKRGPARASSLLRSPLAWSVAAFMGLQSTGCRQTKLPLAGTGC